MVISNTADKLLIQSFELNYIILNIAGELLIHNCYW